MGVRFHGWGVRRRSGTGKILSEVPTAAHRLLEEEVEGVRGRSAMIPSRTRQDGGPCISLAADAALPLPFLLLLLAVCQVGAGGTGGRSCAHSVKFMSAKWDVDPHRGLATCAEIPRRVTDSPQVVRVSAGAFLPHTQHPGCGLSLRHSDTAAGLENGS